MANTRGWVTGVVMTGLVCASAAAWSEQQGADRSEIVVWLDVVDAEGPFVLRNDGTRGGELRQALQDAARERQVSLRIPSSRDAYLLGHVATETAEGQLQLRRFAGPSILLKGDLRLRADGYWDVVWQVDARREMRRGSEADRTANLESLTLNRAIAAGMDLAAGVRDKR